MPDDTTADEHEISEEQCIKLLDDGFEPGEGIVRSRETHLIRCETDRPLYTLTVDGEIATTVDADEFTATHQIPGAFELGRRGEIGSDTDTPEQTPTWH